MIPSSHHMSQLSDVFNHFHRLRLLVVGDLILDHYIWGEVRRISPEAPVPVINVLRHEYRIGGAGNVAANLASLGCQAVIAGFCGDDSAAATLTDLYKQADIESLISTIPTYPTTIKSRVIAQHQQLLRIDEEKNNVITTDQRIELLERIRSQADRFDGMILSDYAKGTFDEPFLQALITLFHDRVTTVDPKGHHYERYRGATVIKPNFGEFRAAVHCPDLTKQLIPGAARKMVQELQLRGLLVTLGEDGVFLLDENNDTCIIPTQAREVYDVSGAGDTFTAAFTAALKLTGNWRLAAQAGNLAAGIVVGKLGTATVSTAEILAVCSQ